LESVNIFTTHFRVITNVIELRQKVVSRFLCPRHSRDVIGKDGPRRVKKNVFDKVDKLERVEKEPIFDEKPKLEKVSYLTPRNKDICCRIQAVISNLII
jgi:hypothetical protein